jgi:hypothetical protein
MSVIIFLLHQFMMTQDDTVYSSSVFDYTFRCLWMSTPIAYQNWSRQLGRRSHSDSCGSEFEAK